jgi:hypothetical protein
MYAFVSTLHVLFGMFFAAINVYGATYAGHRVKQRSRFMSIEMGRENVS